MKTGYLYLETHPEHPGLVRFLSRDTMPDPMSGRRGTAIRYIARFTDIEAAEMHVQNSLHRKLVDIETHMYRTSLPEAMAVVEADNLSHERVWIDPSLNEDDVDRMTLLTEARRDSQRRRDRIWQGVGYLFVGLLLLRALGLF